MSRRGGDKAGQKTRPPVGLRLIWRGFIRAVMALVLCALFGAQAAWAQQDLALSKIVSNPAPNVGDTISFTVTVSNGSSTATGVEVTDQLPIGLSFVSALASQGTYSSGNGIWTVGTVNAGTPQTLTITATVTSPSALTNTATITHSDQTDPNSANDIASVTETPQRADLALLKSVSNPTPNVGDNVIFTVTLSNSGPNPAT